jgi:hypothetical protein
MADSPWVNVPRDKWSDYVNDEARLQRLRADKTFYLQSGWAVEVLDRRPTVRSGDWNPPPDSARLGNRRSHVKKLAPIAFL